MKTLVNFDRLKELESVELLSGGHAELEHQFCVMEAVAYVAGEPWSAAPQCACPVISTFLREWNDALPDADRTRLLRPLIAKLVGTRGSAALEQRRSLMAADWLVRTYTSAWLRLAGLTRHADALAGLPEITDLAQVPGIKPVLEAARMDTAAAWVAAGVTAWDPARDATWVATGDAAGDAAGVAAGVAAWDAAWAAAWDAAGVAAWDAAGAGLHPVTKKLQLSALALVDRMIEARDA